MAEHDDDDDVFVLKLTHAEALVLFDWLTSNTEKLPFEDDAERMAVWRVEAALERRLVEPFLRDYSDRLAAAKRKLLNPGENA